METTKPRISQIVQPTVQPTLRLVFSGNADCGLTPRPSFFLSAGTTCIGRELTSTTGSKPGILLAEDRQVSRLHATVHSENGSLRIVDERSRNGVYLNGLPIAPIGSGSELCDGDVLRIGDSFLVVRYEPLAQRDSDIPTLLGRAPALCELRSVITQVAPTTAMVLLFGERGTGKEVVARAIHALSGRCGPFVAINCSAIPESLAESQLFGHLRGAFTGASPQLGLFRAAEGGTLFLDEVGELSAAIQPKLLRALEEQTVLPVGATKPVPVNVRIVAATNRSLDEEVCQRQFRGDLLARLAGVRLALPPLRNRREDILLLLEKALIEGGSTQSLLHPDLVERLLLYSWPYNVRELFKVAWELQIRGKGLPLLDLNLVSQRLPLSLLQSSLPQSSANAEVVVVASAPASPRQSLDPACTLRRGPVPSKADLQNLLVKHKGIVADIAKEVARSRMQVYRWLTQRGLDVDSFRR